MPSKVNWNDSEIRSLLGVMNDGSLGRLLNISRERVRQVRNSLGIKSIKEQRAAAWPPEGLVERLGKMPDTQIALLFDTSDDKVRALREQHGIERYLYRAGCGTRRSYMRGCRCEDCTRVNRENVYAWMANNPERWKAIKERRTAKVLATAPHAKGVANVSMYVEGCRCVECTIVHKAYCKAKYDAVAAAKEAKYA